MTVTVIPQRRGEVQVEIPNEVLNSTIVRGPPLRASL
jgi:hypothetical protein